MEEQVGSHISDLEGLNSELEGFLSDLHGREEGLSARIKGLEEELSAARNTAAAELRALSEKEDSLTAALEAMRKALASENSKSIALASERDELRRNLDNATRQLDEVRTALSGKLEVLTERFEEAKASLAQKEAQLKDARSASKAEAAQAAAELEEARKALAAESSRLSAALVARDDLERRLQASAELLNEAKAAVGERDVLVKETRAAAREKAAELAAELEKAQAAAREQEGKISALISARDKLRSELDEQISLLKEEKASSEKKDVLLKEARAAAREKAAELSALIEEARAAQRAEAEKAEELQAERQSLLRQLEEAASRLEDEKASSAAKEEALSEARAVAREKAAELAEEVKSREEKAEALQARIDELKADLELERGNVKDREAQLQKAARLREGLEKKLDMAAQENSRSEEGYLLKIELVKKEMRDQAKRADELERKLAAAGARLDDALDEAAKKEKLLSETEKALAEKEAHLRTANQKLSELTKEFAQMQAGAGHESAQRAREAAASMAARVEELENSLSQASAAHMEKFRAVQAELSAVKADLRSKEEENAALLAREETLSRELGDAEEKWKFSTAQLHNASSKLRNAENEIEIAQGRIKSLEEERDKFRTAAIKAETASAALAARESKARDGEAAGLMAALDEQAVKYTDLLRKYDDIVLLNERISHEKSVLKTEADSLRAAFESAQASADEQAGEKLGVQSEFLARMRALESDLKKKEFDLQEALGAADAAVREAEDLRGQLEEKEDAAAGEAEAERARYALLSERVHNAENLLKKKEFELEEAREALSAIEGECSMLRQSREALNEKYAREIHAENEQLREAQQKVEHRDAQISKLISAEEDLKKEAETLKKEKNGLLALMRKKSGQKHSAKVSEAERMLADKESRLVKLRSELENTRAEKAELQGREKELREELKSRPYRAMLREAEEKLLIKEKMLADMNARMKRLGRDFEELKVRGQSSGAPGYLPDFEELVAGVAHQIANSISIIRSHAEFCAEAPDSEGARESLDVIVRNIVTLQKKIDLIMNFSKPVIPQRSPERLSAVVHEVTESLQASGRLGKSKVRVKGGDRLKPVSIDRVRFAAAAEQLILNAAESMPRGGEITVSISSAGGRQRVEVSDKGQGIEKKNLGSVFHPFFTTRHGKMGLGLTLARNVARAHGGALDLHSDPGKGTRAVMELPEIS